LKRELKRQIKQDDLKTGLEEAVHWVSQNREWLRNVGIAVIVVAAGAWGLSAFQEQRSRRAETALAEALAVLEAPVASEIPAGAPASGGTVYATEAERWTKAAAAFDGVERGFASLPAGLRARYFAAICRIELGQTAEAQKTLGEIAALRDGERLEPALARLALADLLRRTSQWDKAIDAYRQAADDPAFPLPRDHALMSLARVQEEAKRPADARLTYRRLFVDFPASVYAGEAKRRADDLETLGG
jgi:hypothetical protein